jgi:hypothetical protein
VREASATVGCTICRRPFSEERPRTMDHVVPRRFYGHEPPPNLLTRPACRPCQDVLAPREERLRNLFAASMAITGESRFPWIIDKASRSNRRLRVTRAELHFEHSGLFVPRNVITIDGQLQDDLKAVFYKIVKGLFFKQHGREMKPVWHRVVLLTVPAAAAMLKTLRDMGTRVQRQGPEFEWLHIAAGDDEETGIWLFKVLNAAVVYVGTGGAISLEMPSARGLIVDELPEYGLASVP